ncbi:MAG TPA: hypothetical protein VL069_04800, partial [Opitutus sp.]|nr:hypothetical protein [Opitutus sp.]
MDFVVLLVTFALLVLVILPVWVFIRINSFSAANELLQSKIRSLELEMSRLRQQFQKSDTPPPDPASRVAAVCQESLPNGRSMP